MAVAPLRKLLEAARQQRRDTAIPPIAVSVTLLPGYEPHDDKTLFEPSLLIQPCPHPVLEAFLETSGATRRGRMSWLVGLGEDYNPAPLRVLTSRLLPGTLVSESLAATSREARDLTTLHPGTKVNTIVNEFAGTAAWLRRTDLEAVVDHAHPNTGPGRFGAVTLSVSNGNILWIKLVTHQLVVPEHLPQIPLNLRAAGKTFTEPKPVRPADAIAVLDWLASEGVTLVDPSENNALAVLRDRVSRSVVATPTPGRPALAQVSIGRTLFRDKSLKLPMAKPEATQSTSRGRMSALDVVALSRTLPFGAAVIHPGTADVGQMALAEPVGDDRLRDYQREAVGLHLSTDLGYLQACAPGMGKTVMSFAAMQRRAAARPGYRALVVAEANVRAQWVSEAVDWFPEATVLAVESRADAPKLAELLADNPDPVVAVVSYGLLPAVNEELIRRENLALIDDLPTAIAADGTVHVTGTPETRTVEAAECGCPDVAADVNAALAVALPACATAEAVEAGQGDLFALFADLAPVASDVEPETVMVEDETQEEAEAKAFVALGALLLDTVWHDIVADEAEVLRGTGTKQGAAMWRLRRGSQVASVLTGTPINRSVDDLGRLISWARGDEHLFHGVRLSTQFDLNDDEQLEEFLESMGPLMFRRDSSEIADELPTIIPTVIKLRPSAEEKALAHAARAELKRVYLELLAWLDVVEATDPDNLAYAEAREGLKAARGAWLGGTQLARMASSDPAALLGSKSSGAALLAGQGLIEAATRTAGTKRRVVVGNVAERVARGERILVFTEFATVAVGILDDLEASGVRAGAVLGGGGKKRDRDVVSFQRGELDVLVCTSSGERGLNLQQATTIVHYDLPWTPKGVIQRTGRAMRIKSENKTLEVVFPLMEGTIEERVAALVVTRAVEAMRALDASRGVDTSQTEMGLALGGLVSALTDKSLAELNGSDLMAMTQALVA